MAGLKSKFLIMAPNKMNEPLAIEAIFTKATTTIDGGWRISFDCGEQAAVEALAKLRDQRLYIVIMTEEQKNERTASLD